MKNAAIGSITKLTAPKMLLKLKVFTKFSPQNKTLQAGIKHNTDAINDKIDNTVILYLFANNIAINPLKNKIKIPTKKFSITNSSIN